MYARITKEMLTSVLTALVLLALTGVAWTAVAQSSGPEVGLQDDVSVAAAVESRINYQGILEENGVPVNGNRDMIFNFFTNDTCAGVAAYVSPTIPVPVDDGFFDVDVQVPHGVFQGEGVWLQVEVAGTLLGCEALLPTPYALSLKPGATIVGETSGTDFGDAILNVQNTTNIAVRGESGDTSSLWQPVGHVGVTGIGEALGVFGSGGTGSGVSGISRSDNGVYGETGSEDYSNTAGVYGAISSGDGTAVRGLKYGDAGIAVYGTNWGNTGSAVVGDSIDYIGVFGESDNYRGIHGKTNRSDHNYGFYTPDNLYSLNYHLMGAIMQVVQNGGESPIEPGDVVVFSGMESTITAGGPPVVQVALATKAHDTGVAGVAYRGFNIESLLQGERVTPSGEGMQPPAEVTTDGPIAPGEYLLLVVHGPTQVKLEPGTAGLQPGALLAVGNEPGVAGQAPTVTLAGVQTAVPGTVLGKILKAPNSEKAYIFVTLD